MDLVKKLSRELEDINYSADAVSMSTDTFLKLRKDFENRFEKPFVASSEIEDFFTVKILVNYSDTKKEFELYKLIKGRN